MNKPKPAETNQKLTIIIDVEDVPIVFQRSTYYSGQELKAGESVGIL